VKFSVTINVKVELEMNLKIRKDYLSSLIDLQVDVYFAVHVKFFVTINVHAEFQMILKSGMFVRNMAAYSLL